MRKPFIVIHEDIIDKHRVGQPARFIRKVRHEFTEDIDDGIREIATAQS